MQLFRNPMLSTTQHNVLIITHCSLTY